MRPAAARRALPFALGFAAVWAAGCGSTGFVRPEGPSRPAPDAAALWRQATASCATISSIQAQAHLSGHLDRQRIPGLLTGVIAGRDGRVALEARLSGAPVFVLAGNAAAVTLLLSRPPRVVTGPAETIVHALVGLAWTPARLLAVLAGCVSPDAAASDAREFPDGVIAVRLSSGDEAYLERRSGRLVVRAGAIDGVVVDYQWGASRTPSQIAIRSEAGRAPAVALVIRVDVAVIDPQPSPQAFAVAVPAGAAVMSVDELRASGPLGDGAGGR